MKCIVHCTAVKLPGHADFNSTKYSYHLFKIPKYISKEVHVTTCNS